MDQNTFNSVFFDILTNNRSELLEQWIATSTIEEHREAFLQSVRMGWMHGVVTMAPLAGQDALDQGVTFAIASNHFDALEFLIPLSTLKHLSGNAITYAVDQNNIQAVTLLLPHVPQMIRDVVLARAAGRGGLEILELVRSGCGSTAIGVALVYAAKEGCTHAVQALAPHCKSDSTYYNTALTTAAQNGWLDTVDFLLPLCDKNAINEAFNTAAAWGYIEVVEQLLPHADPLNNNSQALKYAAQCGRFECVQLLIPLSDPLSGNSFALREASKQGHLECVKLLIPVSNPKANDSEALYDALVHGHMECAEVLGLVCDPHAVLLQLKEDEDDYNEYGYESFAPFLEDMMARQQKRLLETHIEKRRGVDAGTEKAHRKI